MPELVIDPPAPGFDQVEPSGAHKPVGSSGQRRPWWRSHLALPTGSDALLFIAVVVFAVGLLDALPSAFDVDSWLELVAGRAISQTGLPHTETLTVMAHGVRWIDQQWLSQLASYALYTIGGLGLLGVVNVTVMVVGVGAAFVYARRHGARPWIILALFGLCLWQIIPSRGVRTQAFAIPLLVAVLLLLSADSRRPSRRVYWCLPILVLWANLHGTVSIGAGLVSLRGLTLAWERRKELQRSPGLRHFFNELRRPLVLTLVAPLALFLTPYGLHAVTYYRSTLMNSALKHTVTEWQPITSVSLQAIPFFVLAGVTIWSLGRQPDRSTPWEKLTLLILAAGSIDTIRNSMLFAFAALAIVPITLEGIVPQRGSRNVPIRHRLNSVLSWAAIALLVVVTGVTAFRPARYFENNYQRTGVLAAVTVATHADPSVKIFADVRFADWLLWRDPALGGRLANDARFELMSGSSLVRLQRVFTATGSEWKQGARGYGLLVMDRSAEPDAVKGFLQEPGHRVLYNDGTRIVILRSSAQSG